jgi:hypothetical protein
MSGSLSGRAARGSNRVRDVTSGLRAAAARGKE